MRIIFSILLGALIVIRINVCISSSSGFFTSFVGNYRKATVPIVAEIASEGKIIPLSTGTGFLIRYVNQDRIYEFLVTAKHVIKDANQLRVIYNRVPLPGDFPNGSLLYEITYPLEKGKRRFWGSTKDENIDIAVILIAEWENQKEKEENLAKVTEEYNNGSDKNVLLDNGTIEFQKGITIDDIDLRDQLLDVIFMGFPMGLVSKYSAVPIVRSGSIALSSLRGVKDYPIEAFLIEGMAYPGNSGGPVILRKTHISSENAGITTEVAGVISASLDHIDIAESKQTRRARISFEENTGLAIAYPSKFIDEAINNYLKR